MPKAKSARKKPTKRARKAQRKRAAGAEAGRRRTAREAALTLRKPSRAALAKMPPLRRSAEGLRRQLTGQQRERTARHQTRPAQLGLAAKLRKGVTGSGQPSRIAKPARTRAARGVLRALRKLPKPDLP